MKAIIYCDAGKTLDLNHDCKTINDSVDEIPFDIRVAASRLMLAEISDKQSAIQINKHEAYVISWHEYYGRQIIKITIDDQDIQDTHDVPLEYLLSHGISVGADYPKPIMEKMFVLVKNTNDSMSIANAIIQEEMTGRRLHCVETLRLCGFKNQSK